MSTPVLKTEGATSPPDHAPSGTLFSVLKIPLGFTIVFLLFSFTPRVQGNFNLFMSCLGAGAFLLAWLAWLWVTAAKSGRVLKIEKRFIKVHYVQAAMHMSMFLYWGYYWRPVYDYFPLLFAQIAFAYAFVALLSWTRGDNWIFGMGPFPIIFSTNLFIWFIDDWYALQFLMISVGFLAKELITWQKDGRKAHIFNPSAFSLSIFSIALLITGTTDITMGPQIATTFFNPPHIFVFIFMLGMVVQSLFSVTLTTLGAALGLLILNLVYTQITGVYFFYDTGIHAAVFLGLHLLVTDPATSPRTDLGRFIFGLLYGLGVFLLYAIFWHLGVPGHYDKLLPVPLLNLSVQAIDRFVNSPKLAKHRAATFGLQMVPARRNHLYMLVWIALFAGMNFSSFLGRDYKGRDPDFWRQACGKKLRNACDKLVKMYDVACTKGNGKSCNDGGVLFAEGTLVKQSDVISSKAFNESCKNGYEKGCINAAIQFLLFTVKPIDEKIAISGVENACKKGNPQGCFLMGKAYSSGRVVKQDLAMADTLYQRSCTLGYKDACGVAKKSQN